MSQPPPRVVHEVTVQYLSVDQTPNAFQAAFDQLDTGSGEN